MSADDRAAAARPGGARSATAGGGVKARFSEALRRAARGALTEAPVGGAALAARAGTARRAGADGKDAALSRRREGFRKDERDAAPRTAGAPPPQAAPPPLAPASISVPELRALVRALPVAVDAAAVRAGAPLALSFGRSLDVELRSTPAGVEVVLRPAAALARACEAELPRVVRALESRGIAVARARVRSREADTDRADPPRVDLPAGLR